MSSLADDMQQQQHNYHIEIIDQYKAYFQNITDKSLLSRIVYADRFSSSYCNSVVLANYACRGFCPYVVFKPTKDEEISLLLNIANEKNIPVSIKGGGHSYTCQSVKDGGLLFDMSMMKSWHLDDAASTLKLGTGYKWGQVLKKLDDRYYIVHGQCTDVGVAGFSLHGGVHFGGLSEAYGYASDNIIEATIVVYNGSIVTVGATLSNNSIYCTIDTNISRDNLYCIDLFYAVKGSGSSFGVVTSLTFNIYDRLNAKNTIHSALSVLTLQTKAVSTNIKSPALALQKYLQSWNEQNISITLFGLDAYFKSYAFILKFASSKVKAVAYDFGYMFQSKNESLIHFVVEASWYSDGIETLKYLNKVNRDISDAYDGVINARQFLATNKPWSVSSYDLVWGKGHSYAGATIAVSGHDDEANIIQSAIDRYILFKEHKSYCDDCVVVFHLVGNRMRGTVSYNSIGTPIHSYQRHSKKENLTLWLEIDCGLFYRNVKRWPQCQSFVDESQQALQSNVNVNHSFFYPNVPNPMVDTKNYYSDNIEYDTLVDIKHQWDPVNMFTHSQSVLPTSTNRNDKTRSTLHSICKFSYDRKALYNHVGALLALISSLLLSYVYKDPVVTFLTRVIW